MNFSSLKTPFSIEEIKQAVIILSADKAPRPDDFPMFFFQKHWSLVQNDLVKLCPKFFFMEVQT